MNIELIKEFLEYRDGGLYYKKKPCSKIVVGQEAGHIHHTGYKRFMLNGVEMLAHRVIFAMHHGYLPDEVDHINGVKTDNRIENLRAATHSQNAHNQNTRSNNTSGIKGVSWNKLEKRWKVNVCLDGVQKYIGGFKDKASAELAAISARNQLHGEFANHG